MLIMSGCNSGSNSQGITSSTTPNSAPKSGNEANGRTSYLPFMKLAFGSLTNHTNKFPGVALGEKIIYDHVNKIVYIAYIDGTWGTAHLWFAKTDKSGFGDANFQEIILPDNHNINRGGVGDNVKGVKVALDSAGNLYFAYIKVPYVDNSLPGVDSLPSLSVYKLSPTTNAEPTPTNFTMAKIVNGYRGNIILDNVNVEAGGSMADIAVDSNNDLYIATTGYVNDNTKGQHQLSPYLLKYDKNTLSLVTAPNYPVSNLGNTTDWNDAAYMNLKFIKNSSGADTPVLAFSEVEDHSGNITYHGIDVLYYSIKGSKWILSRDILNGPVKSPSLDIINRDSNGIGGTPMIALQDIGHDNKLTMLRTMGPIENGQWNTWDINHGMPNTNHESIGHFPSDISFAAGPGGSYNVAFRDYTCNNGTTVVRENGDNGNWNVVGERCFGTGLLYTSLTIGSIVGSSGQDPHDVMLLAYQNHNSDVGLAFNFGLTNALIPKDTPINKIKIVFETNSKFNGNLGGYSGADNLCKTDINNPFDQTNSVAQALLSGSTTNPVDATDYYLNSNGDLLATPWGSKNTNDDLNNGQALISDLVTPTDRHYWTGWNGWDKYFNQPMSEILKKHQWLDTNYLYNVWLGVDQILPDNYNCNGWTSSTDHGEYGSSYNSDNTKSFSELNYTDIENLAKTFSAKQGNIYHGSIVGLMTETGSFDDGDQTFHARTWEGEWDLSAGPFNPFIMGVVTGTTSRIGVNDCPNCNGNYGTYGSGPVTNIWQLHSNQGYTELAGDNKRGDTQIWQVGVNDNEQYTELDVGHNPTNTSCAIQRPMLCVANPGTN